MALLRKRRAPDVERANVLWAAYHELVLQDFRRRLGQPYLDAWGRRPELDVLTEQERAFVTAAVAGERDMSTFCGPPPADLQLGWQLEETSPMGDIRGMSPIGDIREMSPMGNIPEPRPVHLTEGN